MTTPQDHGAVNSFGDGALPVHVTQCPDTKGGALPGDMSGLNASREFRGALKKAMPGYSWTVHRASKSAVVLTATGTQSSVFNRLSTLEVKRFESDGRVTYEARSAGYGLHAKWLHAHADAGPGTWGNRAADRVWQFLGGEPCRAYRSQSIDWRANDDQGEQGAEIHGRQSIEGCRQRVSVVAASSNTRPDECEAQQQASRGHSRPNALGKYQSTYSNNRRATARRNASSHGLSSRCSTSKWHKIPATGPASGPTAKPQYDKIGPPKW